MDPRFPVVRDAISRSLAVSDSPYFRVKIKLEPKDIGLTPIAILAYCDAESPLRYGKAPDIFLQRRK